MLTGGSKRKDRVIFDGNGAIKSRSKNFLTGVNFVDDFSLASHENSTHTTEERVSFPVSSNQRLSMSSKTEKYVNLH